MVAQYGEISRPLMFPVYTNTTTTKFNYEPFVKKEKKERDGREKKGDVKRNEE